MGGEKIGTIDYTDKDEFDRINLDLLELIDLIEPVDIDAFLGSLSGHRKAYFSQLSREKQLTLIAMSRLPEADLNYLNLYEGQRGHHIGVHETRGDVPSALLLKSPNTKLPNQNTDD